MRLCPLSASTTRWLSVKHCLQTVLAHASGCPDPKSTALRNRTQAGIHPSIDRIMHNSWGKKNILREEVKARTHHRYMSKSRSLAVNFHAAAPYWTPPKSRCRSSRRESCPRLCAWIDLKSLDNFNLQRPNSALVHSETQNTGCCWLASPQT